mgnify:CR=1 FL=1
MPGDEIRAARKKAGMTQTELAERLGIKRDSGNVGVKPKVSVCEDAAENLHCTRDNT